VPVYSLGSHTDGQPFGAMRFVTGGAAEAIGLAEQYQQQHLYTASARLWYAAFAADPRLAEDLEAGHRDQAARAAALAGCGQGKDARDLGDKERARWRQQALDWLWDDLALRGRQLKSWWPGRARRARRALLRWQQDPDLGGVRDREAVARLPEDERLACRLLWIQVRSLLAPAGEHPSRAIAHYTRALRLDPEDALAHYLRGRAYQAQGQSDQAVADYTEAIRLDPEFALAHGARGEAYLAKGDHSRAIVDYTEAIRLDPTFALAYAARGDAYLAKGDHGRAIVDYTEAIRLDPTFASAYNERGRAHLARGEDDQAAADFTEVIRLDPGGAYAYTNRGLAYQHKGDHAQAASDFDEALHLVVR
jgi:tetratricopeptide (TPR) repeat protein